MKQRKLIPRTIILNTFGSLGDLHPYLAIALELKARGHNPVVATSEHYRAKVESLGLQCAGVRPDLSPEEFSGELAAKIMDPATGTEFLVRDFLMPTVSQSYEDLLPLCRDADLLITHPIGFAGRIVAEKLGMRWVSVSLAPIAFCSVYDPSITLQTEMFKHLRWLGPPFFRGMLEVAKYIVRDWCTALDNLRREEGLPAGPHPIVGGQHSPHLDLALFSRAIARRMPDWPRQTRQAGYCFFDQNLALPLNLAAFLEQGEAPIIFTLGSAAVWDARDFYQASLEAATALGRRAVLLIGDDPRNALPASMPPSIIAVPYAPYSALFPRASAIVHQGGAGTTGEALRAGKPMIVVPYGHDQPDNADRITRIGAGLTMRRSQYSASAAQLALRRLLDTPRYARAATAAASIVAAEHGSADACNAILDTLG